MAKKTPADKPVGGGEPPRRRRVREGIHDRLAAAEVAAEEAAGYGWATEAVEAVEAAIDPEHELGDEKED
jgi:hypothetical protein